jgi:hypothetical protein
MTNHVVAGPPMPKRGEERFFERRHGDDAFAWALAGGIAIQGDFESQEDGGRALRVLGHFSVLTDWGKHHGLPVHHIRTAHRGSPPHFHVRRRLAQQLAGRARRPSGAEGTAMADRDLPLAASGEAHAPPTHARLTDGSVVRLVKDCGCLTHEGPCWLHMDHLDRLRNRRLLRSLQAQAAGPTDVGRWAVLCDAYMRDEMARLREKRLEMERRGIVELLRAGEVLDAEEVRRAG